LVAGGHKPLSLSTSAQLGAYIFDDATEERR